MKASVDRQACIGCELCANICPEVFEMDEDQISTVIADPVPLEVEENAREADDSCPTNAINIEE
ncbi:ferredoxin [Sedimentibacter acidaminivorans]|uniref:Ferredoxin n=1 Tax=Sedimentibacter acidaminivorans TaxID=913099 RepID=A0ABS4G9F6_9FIRM|nr:ferredoxin [Sedimentibacter acidaminivorans]MBP1924316.1 ferredoxin [Sedimentibacter acidaminivorans]